ncbi:interleukin-10 receptor subunit beta [Brachyistius frenatus]|uniref:interleukin-10 receptor subunit beta n=1 Tax=Brachyistius frenatus TaxID=100188 RepID=UPI0037E805AA
MAVVFSFALLLLSLRSSAAGTELPPPRDVTMVTLNTNYTVTWDWDDKGAPEPEAVTFTTQFVGKYQLKRETARWITPCDGAAGRSCDLTPSNLHYLSIYAIRVRASANGRHSTWVMKLFCPDKDAAVGPPSRVVLTPAGSDLDVVISDPLSSANTSMREHIPELNYLIMYWERSAQGPTTQTLISKVNMVTLPSLKSWTWYCVSVQTHCDYYNRTSSFTVPHCMQTEGAIPWWQIFRYFLASLVVCFLIMLISLSGSFWCCKTLKATFYPTNQLPHHFKEYLYGPPGSEAPRLLSSQPSESELVYDHVIVCIEPAVLEIHNLPPETLPAPPSGLELDSSGRHSRQNSSSSGDSGVYSAGGSSNSRQPDSRQSLADGPKGPSDPEQVKLREMDPRLKTRPPIVDEGVVVDVCV